MPLEPTDTYTLEKGTWTTADFKKMGWHDVVVHAMAFGSEHHELLFDIDYQFAWVNPAPPSKSYSFWLAPATLVFHHVWDLKMQYVASLGFQLQSLERSEPRKRPRQTPELPDEEYRWTLIGNEGDISFWASGYTHFTRRVPVHHQAQYFHLAERGGISFDRPQLLS